MKQNNKKFNNALHKLVGVLDKYVEKDKCAILRENCSTLNVINTRGYTQICVQRERVRYDTGR